MVANASVSKFLFNEEMIVCMEYAGRPPAHEKRDLFDDQGVLTSRSWRIRILMRWRDEIKKGGCEGQPPMNSPSGGLLAPALLHKGGSVSPKKKKTKKVEKRC